MPEPLPSWSVLPAPAPAAGRRRTRWPSDRAGEHGEQCAGPGGRRGLLMAVAAAIRDHEEIRFAYRDDERSRSSPTGWSAGSDAGIWSPATGARTRGRATGSTGCSCASPAGGDSSQSNCPAVITRRSCSARRHSPAGRCTSGSGVRAGRGGADPHQSRGRRRGGHRRAHCVLVTGADSVEMVAVYIGMLGLDFHVDRAAGAGREPAGPGPEVCGGGTELIVGGLWP